MGKDVIIAADFKDKKETINFLNLFNEEKLFIKIGMELFYSEGPDIVREIKKRGHPESCRMRIKAFQSPPEIVIDFIM